MPISRTAAVLAAFVAIAMGSSVVQAQSMTVPHGTQLYVVTDQRLSSKTSHDGDPIHLVLKNGFFHKNPPALAGAVIDAHVDNDTPASSLHKATMSIVFDDIKLADGKTLPIEASLRSVKNLEPHTHHIRDAGFIIGGAIVGHVVGSHHGVKHGGFAGAAGGFALASAMKSDIVVSRDEQLTLRLTQDLAQ